jgi:hypothetical protein
MTLELANMFGAIAQVPLQVAADYLAGRRVRPWRAARIAAALIAMGRGDLLRGDSGKLIVAGAAVDVGTVP